MKGARNESLHKNVTVQWFSITNEMRVGNQSNRLYANENPPHIIHEMKTIAYNVIDVNIFHFTLMRFHFKKPANSVPTILLPSIGGDLPPAIFNLKEFFVFVNFWIAVIVAYFLQQRRRRISLSGAERNNSKFSKMSLAAGWSVYFRGWPTIGSRTTFAIMLRLVFHLVRMTSSLTEEIPFPSLLYREHRMRTGNSLFILKLVISVPSFPDSMASTLPMWPLLVPRRSAWGCHMMDLTALSQEDILKPNASFEGSAIRTPVVKGVWSLASSECRSIARWDISYPPNFAFFFVEVVSENYFVIFNVGRITLIPPLWNFDFFLQNSSKAVQFLFFYLPILPHNPCLLLWSSLQHLVGQQTISPACCSLYKVGSLPLWNQLALQTCMAYPSGTFSGVVLHIPKEGTL